MKQDLSYGGLDVFRIVAALLIVAIHTSPLTTYSATADFIFVRAIARVAVPFFLLVSGFFLFPRCIKGDAPDRVPLYRFIKKTGLLYLAAIALYLPINIYAGHFADGPFVVNVIQALLFDGTFYHLWYLPAAILGALITYGLLVKVGLKGTLIIAAILYLVGLGGDSYYGLVSEVPALHTFYDALFQVFSYTRNGILYAPIFLALGAWMGLKEYRLGLLPSVGGLIVSLALMIGEGLWLHTLDLQRHDSMYLLLPLVMFFLFQCLLQVKLVARPRLRPLSMLIYILHPLAIIGVRGVAKVAGMQSLLVDNSLVHYVAVCLLTVLISVVLLQFWQAVQRRREVRGTRVTVAKE